MQNQAPLNAITEEEIDEFLKTYPNVKEISLMAVDMLGLPKGKQIHVNKLKDLMLPKTTMPKSLLLENSLGQNFSLPSIHPTDPDFLCYGITGTLQPSLWSISDSSIKESGDTQKIAQNITRGHILISVVDEKGKPYVHGGRELVKKMMDLIKKEFNLTVSLAIELEFYLYHLTDAKDSENGLGKPVHHLFNAPSAKVSSQCYGIDQIENLAPLFNQVRTSMTMQGVEVEGISSEYGDGQFEINTKYRNNALTACDDAILLKHSLKALAKPFGVLATFMAVPNKMSPNGMHINVSLSDENGKNVFAEGTTREKLNDTVINVIGGMEQTVEAGMAIFAPNPNSYIRYYAQTYSPSNMKNWGINNRTVAIRVPAMNYEDPDFGKSMRVEHRVAGADSNVYLATASALGGIYYGLKNRAVPGKMEKGDSYQVPIWEQMPPSMSLALKNWERPDNFYRSLFGDEFCDDYHHHRSMEWVSYMGSLSEIDYHWYSHY